MRFLVAAVLALFPAIAEAQDKETLPPPREQPQPLPQLPLTTYRVVPGPQVGRRDVWELMAVDSRGRFVPRVVQAPVPYYLYNGRPYPWPTTWSLDYMPYTTD